MSVGKSPNKIVKFAVKWSSNLKILSICVESLKLKILSESKNLNLSWKNKPTIAQIKKKIMILYALKQF